MKKFELTGETKLWFGRTLHRIRALVAFGDVDVGELGGWIENESNLDQSGDAWVYGDALVYGDARVYERRAIMWISVIGSRNDTVTFFACKGGIIGVTVGCFHGSIDEFAEKVRKTHGDNEHAQAYMIAIELAKLRVKVEVPA